MAGGKSRDESDISVCGLTFPCACPYNSINITSTTMAINYFTNPACTTLTNGHFPLVKSKLNSYNSTFDTSDITQRSLSFLFFFNCCFVYILKYIVRCIKENVRVKSFIAVSWEHDAVPVNSR